MDGLQGKVKQSLQLRLSVWLSTVILGIAIAAGVFSFASAFHEANELQDDQLRQMAALIHRYPLPISQAPLPQEVPDTDPESRIVVQALPERNAPLAVSRDSALALPANLPDGIQTLRVHDEAWRLFVATSTAGSRVAIGQRTTARDEIARDSALRTLLPFVILVPILLLLVGVLIRQMFKPVKQLASELSQRSEQDLTALSEAHIPSEIRPFVSEINQLLFRVEQSVALQRRFVADAAHELRSPLTALSLQAELLGAADMSAQAKQRLGVLQNGLRRARALLEQLLALARAQELDDRQVGEVSLDHVFRQVLEDLIPLAQAKHIDLGVIGDASAVVWASEIDLKILVKNIVENAIRYTPEGGRVDLSVHSADSHVVLQVDDTGPGIPKEERTRVFDPFYRVLGNDEVGSGLGLSIVAAIAARMGAEVTLDRSGGEEPTAGLRVRVVFRRIAANPSI
ncbi:ATP-binding protein [Eoetvoesiella caeni]|uniref:histidine kinase n=1 Tax=Eoetvoesiella caeni TaxID=645616 RepID=A0A366H1K6_9BURK|nr:ATP-binding protein [Eoetvoesiella caeni]MCI2810943.1 ATP-binding protein [Eoetvoesiella caeni]NYT56842.1 two-component sensor histidine kinase [Eoetvoesiella caeni]RBP35406.1 two-component system OmpR family sensor kinase [Eoetvoesiella caeni]